jgi:hypothetical protein
MHSFEDLMRKQAEIASLAAQIANETNAAKVQAVTATLQRESGELQQMARSFEQQQSKYGQAQTGSIDAARSEEQRQIEVQMRAMAEQVLAQITKASPAAAEAVAKLRVDPNFFGGILLRK